MPLAGNILLVRPSSFVFNSETAGSNAFQNKPQGDVEKISIEAAKEFDQFAETLRSNGVGVTVIEDTDLPVKPDAVFPNNWVSFHEDGTVILYPMFAPNRRLERRPDILEKLKKNFEITRVIDYSGYEDSGIFLEGTGSIVFDHRHKIAYACLSPRTDKSLFLKVSEEINFKPLYFFAHDQSGQEIYHTNVMMCIAPKFVVICMESIIDKEENQQVRNSFIKTGHEIISISFSQMISFAGNMLAVKNKDDEDILVMSQTAYDSLNEVQKNKISQYCRMLPIGIKTIETIGGGSARCMMAEVFLPQKGVAET